MTPADFLALVGPMAREAHAAHGVPASVTLAQAILESGWGESELATKASALFGIKYGAKWHEGLSPYVRGAYAKASREYLSGQWVTVTSDFCRYDSWADSILDHGLFLRRPVYAGAFPATSADDFARAIHAAGYATDPGYSDKLIALMDAHGLRAYDTTEETPMSYDVFAHSRQPNNAYVGGSNEAAQMAALTAQLADLARRDYGRTIVTPPRVDYNGDGAESFYDSYLWINAHARDAASACFFHSNAAGDSMILAADNAASRALRDRMIATLNRAAIMPFGDVWTAYERQVSELTKPVVPIRLVVEVGQHDKADYAEWLRRGIADGTLARKLIGPIAEAYGWTRVADPLVAHTPAPAPTGRLLRVTFPLMRGDDVRQLQREALRVFPSYAKPALGRWGADGFYGKGTEQFVREFQRRHGAGLTVDGKVGNQTRAAMASYGMKGF